MNKTDINDDKYVLQTIVAGVSASTTHAVEIALGTNTSVVIWRDGKVVELSPHDPSISLETTINPAK
jgi:hypothetical protein